MDVQSQECVVAHYRHRRAAGTVLYRVVQNHPETFVARWGGSGQGGRFWAQTERELHRYLECGILAHGFARARYGACSQDFLIAFYCKGRAVYPSCSTRRMAATAAHLADHVPPRGRCTNGCCPYPSGYPITFSPTARRSRVPHAFRWMHCAAALASVTGTHLARGLPFGQLGAR
jgi:hypothetical protein